jgi:hypothetical protein
LFGYAVVDLREGIVKTDAPKFEDELPKEVFLEEGKPFILPIPFVDYPYLYDLVFITDLPSCHNNTEYMSCHITF